jgi:hypothetical protein
MLNTAVSWDVTLLSLVDKYQYSGNHKEFHLLGCDAT